MKEKIMRFMYGRYGMDSLGKCLVIVGLIAMLTAGWTDSLVLVTLSWALIIYAYFRMFSRNIAKRSAENQWYLKKEMKVRGFFQKKKREWKQLKEYHIYRCPNCRQKIRVPRGKGRIAIRCRKCGTEFIKKS